MLFGKRNKDEKGKKQRPDNSDRQIDNDEDDELVTIFEEEEGEGQ